MRDPRTKLDAEELKLSNQVAKGLHRVLRDAYDVMRVQLEAELDCWSDECDAEDRAGLGCNPSVTDGFKRAHGTLLAHHQAIIQIANKMAASFNEALGGMDEPPPEFNAPGMKGIN